MCGGPLPPGSPGGPAATLVVKKRGGGGTARAPARPPRKGPKWLGVHLAEAASAAGRSKGTYLGAQHHRLTGRIGYAKANKAVGHSILVVAWHILGNGVPYEDLGEDWFV
ncbi:transposase IS116/IS110/IS902 family protein, partial [mine drainage metagenome]